jgi:hypothetical protein
MICAFSTKQSSKCLLLCPFFSLVSHGCISCEFRGSQHELCLRVTSNNTVRNMSRDRQLPHSLCLEQCFSTFFWTRHTIFCRESSRHTNVRGGNTTGDSGFHAHSLPSAVIIRCGLWITVVAELQSDRTLQLKYGELSLLNFGCWRRRSIQK